MVDELFNYGNSFNGNACTLHLAIDEVLSASFILLVES